MEVVSRYKSENAREKAFASYDSLLSRSPVPYETRFVETAFGPTHLVASGTTDAPPLVLLHGLGSNATGWGSNVAALADRFRVYALDTIGDLGKSAGTRPKYASGDHARWLNEVFERLGLQRAKLVGMSLGGWIAFHFALAFPDRVDRLVLIAPASLQRISTGFVLRGALATFFPKAATVRYFFRYLASRQYAGMPDWAMDDLIIRWTAGRPNSDGKIPVIQDAELTALHIPTLLLLGSEDPIYDAAKAASRVRSMAPHIEVEIIPNAGHLLPIEQPEATNMALLKFFS
jgi:pimeloyl-ACP methyl ester carboxylesterase